MNPPVLTVTLNAALDVTYRSGRFGWGEQNRVQEVRQRAGGKGINVARALEQLGIQTLVTGMAGGLSGQAIRRSLQAAGLSEELVEIGGESRRTIVAVSESDGIVTEFDEPGPQVSAAEWKRFLEQFEHLVHGRLVVALCGSLPGGLPETAYGTLAETAARHGVPAVLDSSGAALAAGLAGRPAVAKPNLKELLEASGRPGEAGNLLELAKEFQRRGAQAVVVSKGKDGLVALTPEGAWRAVPPEVYGNPVGAGDTVVAGIIAGLIEGRPWPERVRVAAALSAAAVAHPVAGGFDAARYPGLLSATRLERLDVETEIS
jgi:1-phosphofructokinase family hexose kinase